MRRFIAIFLFFVVNYVQAQTYHSRDNDILNDMIIKSKSLRVLYGNESAEYISSIETICRTIKYCSKQELQENQNINHYLSLIIEDAEYFCNVEKYTNALYHYEKALEIVENGFDETHPLYVFLLTNISISYDVMGNYDKAIEGYLKVLKVQKKNIEEDYIYVKVLCNIGTLYREKENYDKALKYLCQALTIVNNIYGEDHPECISILENIGAIFVILGDYNRALSYFNQSLTILNNHQLNSASVLNNIGIVYLCNSDYNRAFEYFKKSEKICEDSTLYANVLLNIGGVFEGIGNYAEALIYYEYSKSIVKNNFGENNKDFALILERIGSIYGIMLNYDRAIECFEYSKNVIKSILGDKSLLYASILTSIGLTYDRMGYYGKQLDYYWEALNIVNYVLGDDNSYYATCLAHISDVYAMWHKYDKSLKYYQKVLSITEKIVGDNHPDYANSLNNIGCIYWDMGNYIESLRFFCKTYQIQKHNLQENFLWLTEKERELYWNENNSIYTNLVDVNYRIPQDTSATKLSYDAELIKKGLLLTSEVEFQKIIQESGDSSLLADFEEMRTIRIMLNKQYEKPIAERTLNCDSLETVAEELEKHLVKNCKEYGDFTRSLALTWQDVQGALGKNDVAIEFSNFELNQDSTMYVALVLTKDMEAPKYIPLFEKKEFESRLQEAKIKGFDSDSTRGAMESYRNQMGAYESTAMYEMVWEPLERYFSDSSKIYFAPSGMFHQLAIEYAPIDETQTMSDKYELYRVSSTKFLAMDYQQKDYTSSVMYGGIKYDSDTTQMKSESSNYEQRGDEDTYNSNATYNSFAVINRDVRAHKGMKYLPGTKAEVEEIKICLDKNNISTTLFEGEKASEESFKALGGQNVPILHIATHGFYLDADTSKYKFDMSMSQTGLMFAGSNLAWTNQEIPEGVEDGILTAKEISHVDLRKTDLVVLSACQTGLGEVTGEGVFGLQRGFKNAGVKTIIMSLWSVDDFATKLMMTEFYTHLAAGKSKRESFNLAQSKVRETYEDPYYWAGFIMLD